MGKTPDLKTVLPEVGRAFSDLRQQYPAYEYLHLGGCDCSLECLGEPGGESALVFFGTQAGPGLDEVAPSRQTELKCAGIYTSLGQVFTLSEDKTVEDLLKSLNICHKRRNMVKHSAQIRTRFCRVNIVPMLC